MSYIDYPIHLTPRQHEVLELLVEGASNNEIARSLSITGSTAEQHVIAILSRMGVRNRTEAAVLALRVGLVEQKIGDSRHDDDRVGR